MLSLTIALLLMAVIVLSIGYFFASLAWPMLTGGAGFTPSSRRSVAEGLELAGLKRDEVFYDLGCGTGEALIEAEKMCDHTVGIEIEPLRWLIARRRAKRSHVILGNLFKHDFSRADVVFIFQFPGKINERVVAKIKSGTRPGTRVVSHIHPLDEIAGLTPVARREDIGIYIYRT